MIVIVIIFKITEFQPTTYNLKIFSKIVLIFHPIFKILSNFLPRIKQSK